MPLAILSYNNNTNKNRQKSQKQFALLAFFDHFLYYIYISTYIFVYLYISTLLRIFSMFKYHISLYFCVYTFFLYLV